MENIKTDQLFLAKESKQLKNLINTIFLYVWN